MQNLLKNVKVRILLSFFIMGIGNIVLYASFFLFLYSSLIFVLLNAVLVFVLFALCYKLINEQVDRVDGFIQKENDAFDLQLKNQQNYNIHLYEEYIFSITHELRSPLAVMNSNLSYQMEQLREIYNELYGGCVLCPSLDEKFKNIKYSNKVNNDQIDIIESFIKNLSEYQKYSSSKNNSSYILEVNSFLKNIIPNSINYSRSMKVIDSIIIDKESDFHGVHVLTNVHDLTRIFMNILKNSAEAIAKYYHDRKCADNMYTPQIKIKCLKAKNNNTSLVLDSNDVIGPFGTDRKESPFYLIIEDNGPGITPENLKKIFKMNFTTKITDENFGMGLNISMNLARDNDISIFLHTKEGCTRIILGFDKIINIQPYEHDKSKGDIQNDCTGFTYSIVSEYLYKEVVKKEVESEHCIQNFTE